jgi:hypothetical protein
MKHTFPILLALIFAACASADNPPPPNHPIDPAAYQPPTDLEMELREHDRRVQEKQAVISEERAYQASIARINQEFANEHLAYEICVSIAHDGFKPMSDCVQLLKRFCVIDEDLDTRGVIHIKPYCRPVRP